MSTENVQKIIGRVMTEPEYRELLFTDSAKALEGYELSEHEVEALKGLSREKFDAAAGELEVRISRAGMDVKGALHTDADSAEARGWDATVKRPILKQS